MTNCRWPDGVHLLLNAGPDPHWPRYDIWRTGGPGGPWLESETEEAAHAIIDAIDELHLLRAERAGLIAEVERLRAEVDLLQQEASIRRNINEGLAAEVDAERAAVVAWLREHRDIYSFADCIEQGEHRREDEP